MNYLKNIIGHSLWSTTAALLTIVLQAILYFVITRFIVPEELGLYALASSFIFIFVTILENSFSNSLISLGKPDEKDYSSVLAINIIASLAFSVLSLFFAFSYSHYFQHPPLFTIVLTMIPILVLTGYNSVHYAGLKNKLNFNVIAIIDIIGISVFFISTISFAFLGLGLWSLVYGMLFRHITTTLSLIFSGNLCCSFGLDLFNLPWRKHYAFGKYIMLEKGFSSLIGYADVFLINHFLGLNVLGIYDIIKKIIIRPVLILYASLEQIIFPMLSQNKSNSTAYNLAYKDFQKMTAFIFISCLALIYINSDFIIGFFPAQYSNFNFTFQLLAILCSTMILINPIDIILYSVGKTRTFLIWFLSVSLIQLLIMYFSVQYNIDTFIMSMSAFNLIIFLFSYFLLIKRFTLIEMNNYFIFFLILITTSTLIYIIKTYTPQNITQIFILNFTIIALLTYSLYKTK